LTPKSKEWQHIAWRVTFTSPRGKFETGYRQGIGHLPNYKQGRITLADEAVIKATLKTGHVCRWVDGFNQAKPTITALTPPTAADVVYSLMSDAEAADYATFEEWAAAAGYDTDSRSAEKIYNACRAIALDLYRVFGAAVLDRLRPIVQEM
jgi:hypothetical protein